MTLGLMAIAFSQSTMVDGEAQLDQPWGTVALLAANGFVVFFGATCGPIMWVMLGEMFPNRIRAAAISVATAFNWLANFAVSTTFPVLSNISLTLTYSIYAAFALVSYFYVLERVPETKGVELEDMSNEGYVKVAKPSKGG